MNYWTDTGCILSCDSEATLAPYRMPGLWPGLIGNPKFSFSRKKGSPEPPPKKAMDQSTSLYLIKFSGKVDYYVLLSRTRLAFLGQDWLAKD